MIRWRQRSIREVMIRRSQGIQSEKQKRYLQDDACEDTNLEISIRGGEMEVEQMMKIIQQKARVNFYQGFDKKKFQRIVVQRSTVIEQSFDLLACSYLVISGSIFLIDSSQSAKRLSDFDLERKEGSQAFVIIQRGEGIGWLFGRDKIPSNYIWSNKAVLLRVEHNGFDMKKIQKECLMTNYEKVEILKKFQIFSLIDNAHKVITPFIKPYKKLKGQSIYREGQKSKDFYILIEGEVSFSSSIRPGQNPEQLSCLSKWQFKSNSKSSIVTYSLSKDSFFGQQQMLQNLPRQETAFCSSIQCIILMIPGSKLFLLLNVPQIKRILTQSAAMKQETRIQHIQSYLDLPMKAKTQAQQLTPQSNQGFQHLKSTIFFNLFKPSEKSVIKSKYSRDQNKVFHNHSVPVEHLSPLTQPSTPFSMLAVNKEVYEKTLMRFRYSLKEIKGQNKFIQPPQRGRSLQSICKTLKLTQSFFCFDHQGQRQSGQGMAFYNTANRLKRHIRITKSLKPKNMSCTNKLKSEYIDYLQLAI